MRQSVRALLIGTALAGVALAQPKKEPVDYVSPHIGGIGHLLTATSPLVQLPYGMMRLMPNTTEGPERYLARKISGFPAGGVVLMPTTGPLETDRARYASDFDRDFETVTPYYGSDVLDKYGITVEYTAGRRSAFYRFTYPRGGADHVLLVAGGGEIQAPAPDTITGSGGGAGGREYFYAVFSRPFSSPQTFQARAPEGGRGGRAGGRGGNAAGPGLAVDVPAGEPVTVRIGMSYISVEQAHKNLTADIPEANFERVKVAARAAWNRELGKLAVEGGSEKQRTIFYTALYRSMDRPNDITEEGG